MTPTTRNTLVIGGGYLDPEHAHTSLSPTQTIRHAAASRPHQIGIIILDNYKTNLMPLEVNWLEWYLTWHDNDSPYQRDSRSKRNSNGGGSAVRAGAVCAAAPA